RAENKQLIGYLRNRQVWPLDADEKPTKLSPYANAVSVDVTHGANYMLLLIEFLLVVLALVLALVAPNLGASWFERAERALSRLARRRGLAVLSVGSLALVLRAALLPILPIPEPLVHDEFSYLLASD